MGHNLDEIILWIGMRYRFLMEHAIGIWNRWSLEDYQYFLPDGLDPVMTDENVQILLTIVWELMREINDEIVE